MVVYNRWDYHDTSRASRLYFPPTSASEWGEDMVDYREGARALYQEDGVRWPCREAEVDQSEGPQDRPELAHVPAP